MSEPSRRLAEVLRLEAARLLGVARMVAGDDDAPAAMARVEAELDEALASLEAIGVAHPGHVLAARYGLDGADYVVLAVALLPHHAPEVFAELVGLLQAVGAVADEVPRLSHALALLAPMQAWPEVAEELSGRGLFTEGLVRARADEAADDDPVLAVHLAVLELYGLAAP